jgi:hypothetical protein
MHSHSHRRREVLWSLLQYSRSQRRKLQTLCCPFSNTKLPPGTQATGTMMTTGEGGGGVGGEVVVVGGAAEDGDFGSAV